MKFRHLGFCALLLAAVAGAQAPAGSSDSSIDKMRFEVASVKPSDPNGGRGRTNVPLTEGERWAANGGLFTSTGQTVLHLIAFAYGLNAVPDPQLNALPEWAKNDHYDIEAHAARPATKEEMRAMVRNLLADRFHLVAHYEVKNVPIFELVMTKPGKFGPQMRAHVEEGLPCPDNDAPAPARGGGGAAAAPGGGAAAPTAGTLGPPPTPGAAAAAAAGGRGGGARATPDGYPTTCGDLMGLPGAPTGRTRLGGRNVTMEEFMASLRGGMERPIVDHTGLTGRFDWWIEYVQDPSTDGAAVATSGRYLDPDGPKLWTAIQEQLGLQLKATKGDARMLIFDNIEKPTAN